MQAILLAAGNSSRFYPLNETIEHKSLVEVMGKSLLEHTIESLKTCGITDIVIVTRKNSIIPNLCKNITGIHCTFVEQPAALGMGDALLRAKKYLKKSFFLLGAYHMDVDTVANDMRLLQKGDSAVVLVKKDTILNRYGNVTLDGNKVVDIVEKPARVSTDGFRLLSIYLLPKMFIKTLESLETEEYHFEKALAVFAKNETVVAMKCDKSTISLKYVWDLLAVKEFLLGRLKQSAISKTASIATDVLLPETIVIEDDVTIMEGVCIKGYAYIGKGVTIGNRAILRGGVVVEKNAMIGSQMEVKNAFIMEGTTTHAGFIGDSVIGRHTKIAGGFMSANARLDRQPVVSVVKGEKVNTGLRHFGAIIGDADNIGVRVSTMPGVIVGNSVIVGPATTVMKNIESNRKYYTKFQEVVEEIHSDAK